MVALLNADDPRVMAMAARTAARVVTFGRSAAADVRAEDVRLDEPRQARFPAGHARPESGPVQLRLYGEHNVHNALAAAALAGELGMPVAEIAQRLSGAEARSRWRMEVTERPDGVIVLNDAYNANPESVRAALDTLAVLARGRRSFAVLGPMSELGAHSRARHEEIGGYAAADRADRPHRGGQRRRLPSSPGPRPSRPGSGELVHAADAASAALDALGNRLAPGDVVLVKASRSAGLERVALALTGELPAGARARALRTILFSAGVSLLLALFGTPLAIRIFSRRGYGQLIREEGPAGTRPSAAPPPWAGPSS